MRLPVYNAQGKRTEEILEFDEHIFGDKVRRAVLKENILMYEARQRLGTHSTKTRGQCSGTGRKLWRQKGTGRARVGPARAPHWKGGGVVFGPHPRDYSYSIPKKAKRVALSSAWLAKFESKEIIVIEGFNLTTSPKTSIVFDTLEQMGVSSKNTIIALHEHNEVLWRSARNIPKLSVKQICDFNPYFLLFNKWIVVLRPAFEELVKNQGGEIKILNRKDLYTAKK